MQEIKKVSEAALFQQPLVQIMYRQVPIAVASMMIFGSGMLIDAYFMGRMMDAQAVIAINVILPWLGLLMIFDNALATGLAYTVSSLNHSQHEQRAGALWLALAAALLAAVVMLGLGVGISPFLASYPELSRRARLLAGEYLGPWLYLGFFYFSSNLCAAYYRGRGQVSWAAIITLCPLVVNAILTPLLIPIFAIRGAIYATIIAYALSSLFALSTLTKSLWQALRTGIDWALLRSSLIWNGLFGAILQAAIVAQQALHFWVAGRLNSNAELALLGLSYRFYSIVFLGVLGIMGIFQPLLAVATQRQDLARQTAVLRSFAIGSFGMALLLGAALWVSPEWYFRSFLADLQYQVSADSFQYFFGSFALVPLQLMAIIYLQTVQRFKAALSLIAIRQLILFPALLLLLAHWLGPMASFWVMSATDGFMLVLIILLRRFIFTSRSNTPV